jgi:hypothetical protein
MAAVPVGAHDAVADRSTMMPQVPPSVVGRWAWAPTQTHPGYYLTPSRTPRGPLPVVARGRYGRLGARPSLRLGLMTVYLAPRVPPLVLVTVG